jgi:hypothetical protein
MKPLWNDWPARTRMFAPLGLLAVLWTVPARTVGEDSPAPALGTVLGENGIPVGWVLIEGDIQVPADWLQNRAAYTTSFWGDGVVPVEFDGNVNSSQEQQAWNAMQIWEDAAHVNSRPRVWNDLAWVHFRDSSGDPEPENSSPVGWGLGQRTINIVDWASTYIIAHEVGHTLCFWHEQSRPNRDDYVRIEWAHIPGEYEYNFELHAEAGDYPPGGYDFDSLMHYSQCTFSSCLNCPADLEHCRTITVLPPNESWQTRIGQRSHLSTFDAMTMSFLYPQPSWWFVDRDYQGTQEGTFLQPYRSLQGVYPMLDNGDTVWFQPGAYSAVGIWGEYVSVTLRAPLGGVVLGN